MAARKQSSTAVRARKAQTPTKNGSSNNRTTARAKARTAEASPNGITNTTGQPRLGKGGLEQLVSDHLKAHPRADFSPAELANLLGRSGGAIANALEKFVATGKATRISDKPRRYRHRGGKGTNKATAKKASAKRR